MQPASRRIAFVAAFAALAVAFGFLLAAVPNIELMTLTVFLGGAVCGVRDGALVGLAATAVFSLLNPWGVAFPLVFVGQLTGMASVGAAGGLWAPRHPKRPGHLSVVLGALGLGLTAIYDLLTNLGLGLHVGRILPTVVGGVPFMALHVASNAAVFATLGTVATLRLSELGYLRRSV